MSSGNRDFERYLPYLTLRLLSCRSVHPSLQCTFQCYLLNVFIFVGWSCLALSLHYYAPTLNQTINYELHATQIYCNTLHAEKQEQLARTNLNNQTARALTKLTINAIRQPKGRKAETEKPGSSNRTRRGGKTNATQLPKPSTRRIQLNRVAMTAKKKSGKTR